MIYSEVKDKSQRMNMWKSSQNTKAEKLKGKYLKVSLMSYLFSFIVEEGSTQICYNLYFRNSPTYYIAISIQSVVLLVLKRK